MRNWQSFVWCYVGRLLCFKAINFYFPPFPQQPIVIPLCQPYRFVRRIIYIVLDDTGLRDMQPSVMTQARWPLPPLSLVSYTYIYPLMSQYNISTSPTPAWTCIIIQHCPRSLSAMDMYHNTASTPFSGMGMHYNTTLLPALWDGHVLTPALWQGHALEPVLWHGDCIGNSPLTWRCIVTSPLTWTCIGTSPLTWTCIDTSPLIWTCIDTSPLIWTCIIIQHWHRPSGMDRHTSSVLAWVAGWFDCCQFISWLYIICSSQCTLQWHCASEYHKNILPSAKSINCFNNYLAGPHECQLAVKQCLPH